MEEDARELRPSLLNTGGIAMKIMKAIGTSLVISLLTMSVAQADSFGSYSTSVDFEQNYAESLTAVEASRKLRKSGLILSEANT